MSGAELKSGRIASRRSNIELLRIIAMIMIVANHFATHSGFEFAADTIYVNRFWIRLIAIGGKIGVDVFVLISGYFSVGSPSFKTSKPIKLWLQIFTYSAAAFLVFVLSGAQPFSVKALITHVLPVTFSHWWFASVFFVLYLVSPFLNKLLNSFDKKTYKRFIALLFVLWCLIPTLTGQDMQCNNLLWFVFVYSFAGYIRLYAGELKHKSSSYLLLSFALAMLTFTAVAAIEIFSIKIPVLKNYITFLYSMNRVPAFVCSVLMLLGFLKIDIGKKSFINIISSATFGVYLIHDEQYIREFLWGRVFKSAAYSGSRLLIPYTFLVVAAVFAGCVLIELARIYLLENHYAGAVNKLSAKIDSLTERIFKDK